MLIRAGVDKIKVRLDFPNLKDKSHPDHEWQYANYGGIREWVNSVAHDEFAEVGALGPGKAWSCKAPAAMTNAAQPLAGGGTLFLRYGCHIGSFRAWVEFNPDKYHTGELAFHFNLMLSQGFETLYRHGATPYCEAFIDVDGALFEEHYFLDTALRKSRDHFVAAGTCYLGHPDADRSLTIYDKAKQLEEVEGTHLGYARLRVEAKLRAKGLLLRELDALANPFGTLLIISKPRLQAVTGGPVQKLKKWIDMGYSAEKAYWSLNKTSRAAAKQELLECQPDWWSPELIWPGFAQSLQWVDQLRHAGLQGDYWFPPQAFTDPTPACLPVGLPV